MANEVVNHRVRIVLKPLDKKLIAGRQFSLEPGRIRELGAFIRDWTGRIADIMELLCARGWHCRGDLAEIVLENDQMEAAEAKSLMQEHGFSPSEFEIRLEYVRKWGML